MADNIYKFKIIPINERYYNEETNYGVFVFKTQDNIPYGENYEDIFSDDDTEYKISTLVGKMQRLF